MFLQDNSTYWTHGFGRLTELHIEGNFGELRNMTNNSQLSVKTFCTSSATRTLNAVAQAEGGKIVEGAGPISAKQFPGIGEQTIVFSCVFCLCVILFDSS